MEVEVISKNDHNSFRKLYFSTVTDSIVISSTLQSKFFIFLLIFISLFVANSSSRACYIGVVLVLCSFFLFISSE